MRILIGTFLAIVVPLLLGEFTDWCPWLATQMVRWAAQLLPAAERARWEEEWLGDLHHIPGRLSKLAWAILLPLAAIRVRRVARPPLLQVRPNVRALPGLLWYLLFGGSGKEVELTFTDPRRPGMRLNVAFTPSPEGNMRDRSKELRTALGFVRFFWGMAARFPSVPDKVFVQGITEVMDKFDGHSESPTNPT
jgi:hypothetical protein